MVTSDVSTALATKIRPTHDDFVARLHRKSVEKHFDAYLDVDWNAPEHVVEHDDPRFELSAERGLGRTEWYRAQAQSFRAQLGLHVMMQQMRLGMDFESVLMRGLLELAGTCAPGSPDLQYAYQEIIEESQHSLMFQETIARAGLPVTGLTGIEAIGARRVPKLARTFPELFFVHVLGGEGPIDHLQKIELARRDALHPLLRRVIKIHVTEEARHIAYAASFLRDRVPRLSALRMFQLRVATPITLSAMSRQMLEPPRWLLDMYGVPKSVRREAFRDDVAHRRHLAEGVRPFRDLCVELGIARGAWVSLWRTLGIWDETPVRGVLAASCE